MPRIDPLQLLKCLSVLLSPEGGILSQEEVPRLVNLMTKFSKKLVSKCVYILILRSTATPLVDMFMAEGGWALIQTWLQDAAHSGNWDLVRETLELLLVTPVDVERLKTNSLPKLIKTLSRREDLHGVAHLSNQIVQNWLVIVKQSGQSVSPAQYQQSQLQPPAMTESNCAGAGAAATPQPESETSHNGNAASPADDPSKDENEPSNGFYKVSVKDGKQVIQKCEGEEEKKEKEEEKKKKESSSSSKQKHSSGSSRRSKSHSSGSRDKDKRRSSSSSSSSSKSRSHDKSKKSSSKDRSSSSRSKDKEKDRKSSKDHKEKQSEKDKDTLAKLKPQVLDKLGRIPKKPLPEKNDKKDQPQKKPSFSILERKPTSEERAKTVKVFNSKMRSTGLEQEVVKPPPSRSAATVKRPPPPPVPVAVKKASPPREAPSSVPPEKRIKMDKVDAPERPGAIKLIPPKPKPAFLQESDIFMDALTASATAKKETKKRKRRLSVTKEPATSPTSSPVTTTAPTTTVATTESSTPSPVFSAPINFYQDTLNEKSDDSGEAKEENKENDVEEEVNKNNTTPPTTPTDNDDEEEEPKKLNAQGLRGVLLYAKKKGPKRAIQWKADEDLVEIRYFELDETERINVTRTFTDMAKMEMTSEREALQMSRKLPNEDVMEAQTPWRLPIPCDQPEQLVSPGCKSLEKDIQFAREKSVLQALYFDKRRIPDSAEEPDVENHPMSDPVIIPLEDPDSQEIDLRNTPWPEPKGSPPELEVQQQVPPRMIPAMFPGVGFIPPQQQQVPPQVMPPFQPPPQQLVPMVGPQMGPQHRFAAPNAPPMFRGALPPPGMMMGPPPQDAFVDQQQQGGGGFAGPPPPQGFAGPAGFGQAFAPPAGFGHQQRGRGGGPFRRGGGGGGGWVRLNANGAPGAGGGGGGGNWKRMRGGRICKNVQNHGYCRNRDNCSFIHP